MPVQWLTSLDGWVLVNWDAALNKDRGQIGIGVLLRDHIGKMIIAKSLIQRGYLSPTKAEALAADIATQICKTWDMESVLFVGDAKVIIDAINSGERSWSMRSPIIQDLNVHLQEFSQWRIAYCNKETNQLAHELARLATSSEMDELWVADPSASI
jgi:ribonuclease HI